MFKTFIEEIDVLLSILTLFNSKNEVTFVLLFRFVIKVKTRQEKEMKVKYFLPPVVRFTALITGCIYKYCKYGNYNLKEQ